MQSKVQIKSIGIDLGKTTFHLIALGARSQVVIRKKFSRTQLLEYTTNLPPTLIGWRQEWGRISWDERCANRGTRCG